MRKVVIFGATSAIAQAAARVFAESGDAVFLVARDRDKVDIVATDLTVRGVAEVRKEVLDLADIASHRGLIERIVQGFGKIDVALIAYGTLGDQRACERDFALAEKEFRTNFLSAASLITELANYFERQSSGVLAVITSVAGDRGRQSNYVYGAAKGGLSIFLAGVRNRLAASGVSVVNIKPGFVDTPMTASMRKGALFVTPDVIGQGIVKAINQRRNVAYLPWFWLWIMLIIKHIPEPIFKRLKL